MSVCPRSLLLGLLIILYLQPCVVGQKGNTPSKCCFSFYKREIPMNLIAKYEKTRSDCPKAGVIFTTKRGISVCTKPRPEWVKRAVDYIDRQIVENNSTSASV
ncbi:hypothetical protein MHYP_G00016320 [Metynnis hypsauchen]